MTLKCIQMVYDSITERFFRTLGPRTKYFESLNNMYKYIRATE